MITVILMEPENPQNIGSIARTMANFGLKELILISPKCRPTDEGARNLAKHAKDILKYAVIADKSILSTFDYVVGTTAKLGSDYNIPRSPLTPAEFAGKVNRIKGSIALLMGREGIGLTNEEVLACDFIVTIPVSKAYPTLNISHAAAILFYELFKKMGTNKVAEHITPISRKDKEVLLSQVEAVLAKMKFATPQKRETQRRVWKRMVGKAMLTRREAFALIGFLKKL